MNIDVKSQKIVKSKKSKNEKEKENKEIKDKSEIKTQKDKIETIISKANGNMVLSNRYYELITKEKYRNQCI